MITRHVNIEIHELLKIMPVVLLRGARQSGKTTWARRYAKERGATFYTFDDPLTLSSARGDPMGWVSALPERVVIDEVQRAMEIMLPIKKVVDEKREIGRFFLTGSANPLLLPKMGDSLAGRMGIVDMYPFSQGEILEQKETFIEGVFAPTFTPSINGSLSLDQLAWLLVKGGFPSVQSFDREKDINRWIGAYIQTMLDRDVRDLSKIEGLREFPRLLRLLAARTSSLLNHAELSRALGCSHMTIHRYLDLLGVLFFINRLPGWYSNRGKRMTKSPKIHFCDTAFLAYLLDINAEKLVKDPMVMGTFLETFVFTELIKLQSWSSLNTHLYHFRDGSYEVDFILEKSDGQIVGIEVKRSQTLQKSDLRGLKHLKGIAKETFHRGIILHLGKQAQQIEEGIWALPLESLWQG